MKPVVIFIAFSTFISLPLLSQAGYLFVGDSYSYSHGVDDMLVYRLDLDGNELWRKNFGGAIGESANCAVLAGGGGFYVAGTTTSYTHGGQDILVYKLDANGNKLWRKNFGGTKRDLGLALAATSDGGLILGGDTKSYTTAGTVPEDMLLYKINSSGQKQWRRNYGGINTDRGPYEIVQTGDGGYIMCGDSWSYGVAGDFLVYKLSASGSKQWRKHYGGDQWDAPLSIQQTADGGYVVAGRTSSWSHGTNDSDALILKLDSAGNLQWQKNFGGTEADSTYSVKQTSDGGFILLGTTTSYHHGVDDSDLLVYKLDATGNKLWRKNFGGIYDEHGFCVQLTTDGGYIICGRTWSYVHGTPDNDIDFLAYKLNSIGNKQWRRNYGGTDNDHGQWIEVIPD